MKSVYSEFKRGNLAKSIITQEIIVVMENQNGFLKVVPAEQVDRHGQGLAENHSYLIPIEECLGLPINTDILHLGGFEPVPGLENVWFKNTVDNRGFSLKILNDPNGKMIVHDTINNLYFQYYHELQNSFKEYSGEI